MLSVSYSMPENRPNNCNTSSSLRDLHCPALYERLIILMPLQRRWPWWEALCFEVVNTISQECPWDNFFNFDPNVDLDSHFCPIRSNSYGNCGNILHKCVKRKKICRDDNFISTRYKGQLLCIIMCCNKMFWPFFSTKDKCNTRLII